MTGDASTHLKINGKSYVAKIHGKAVTQYEFSLLFAEAWYAAMTAKNIQAEFKVTGMFPFNRHPFDLPNEKYKSFRPKEVVRKSKLKYIPLYSPAPCCRRHIPYSGYTVRGAISAK